MDIYLPGQNDIVFPGDEYLQKNFERGANSETMLTAYFERNKIDPQAQHIKYADFPRFYTWHPKSKEWRPRQRGNTIGRIYAVYPSDPERWHLRLLLNDVTGATSFDDLFHF